jgi:cytochrome c-type biogenesis protein CcmH
VRLRAALAAVAGALCLAAASDPAERLPDPALEARAREIFRDVRCVVCQNESIDDSEAELARDLRRIVREQVTAGRSEAEVKRFLTDRYGEFVLLTPRWSAGNLVLWIGPFVVLLAGAALLLLRLRNRTPDPELTPLEAERLRSISDDPAP